MVSSRANPRSKRTTSSLTARKRGRWRATPTAHVSRTMHSWYTGSAPSSFERPEVVVARQNNCAELRRIAQNCARIARPVTDEGALLAHLERRRRELTDDAVAVDRRGSYSTTAKLWWVEEARGGGDLHRARNWTWTSPSATGTVLRSTRTSPRLASTTTPAPTTRPATPSIWLDVEEHADERRRHAARAPPREREAHRPRHRRRRRRRRRKPARPSPVSSLSCTRRRQTTCGRR